MKFHEDRSAAAPFRSEDIRVFLKNFLIFRLCGDLVAHASSSREREQAVTKPQTTAANCQAPCIFSRPQPKPGRHDAADRDRRAKHNMIISTRCLKNRPTRWCGEPTTGIWAIGDAHRRIFIDRDAAISRQGYPGRMEPAALVDNGRRIAEPERNICNRPSMQTPDMPGAHRATCRNRNARNRSRMPPPSTAASNHSRPASRSAGNPGTQLKAAAELDLGQKVASGSGHRCQTQVQIFKFDQLGTNNIIVC